MGSRNTIPLPPLFQLPHAGKSPSKESDDEDVDHTHRRRRTDRGRFFRPGTGHHGGTFLREGHEGPEGRKLPNVDKYLREWRPVLAVFELGSLREGREASEPELFAEPEQEHDRLQAVSL